MKEIIDLALHKFFSCSTKKKIKIVLVTIFGLLLALFIGYEYLTESCSIYQNKNVQNELLKVCIENVRLTSKGDVTSRVIACGKYANENSKLTICGLVK